MKSNHVTARSDVLAPFVPDDPLMAIFWYPALFYAIGDAATVAAFRAETGNAWTPGRTPIERAIDEASGVEAEFVRQFAAWFNENVWGDEASSEDIDS